MNPEMEAILANYADIIYSDGKNSSMRDTNDRNQFTYSNNLDDMMISSYDQNHMGGVIETRSGVNSGTITSTVTDQGVNDLQNPELKSDSKSFWQRWFSIPLGWFWDSE